ncbi:MAG: hypothetical protein PF689_00660 [Deltaproteobacteria bacterium]|jgi:hypothetical protein|nr:hypothetical protein [Deltaproteobacteria bacterium]
MKYGKSFLLKWWSTQLLVLALLINCSKDSDNNHGSTSPEKKEKTTDKTSGKKTNNSTAVKLNQKKQDTSSSKPQSEKNSKKCIYKLNPRSYTSYLRELRSKHKVPLKDFQQEFPAKPFGTKAKALEHTKKYNFQGEPLFFFDPEAKKAVVNQKVFSDLKQGNPSGYGKKEIKIGKIKPEALTKLSPAKITKFLLQAQIILTYAHIEAKLCALNEKKQKNNNYEISFKVESIYYTNQKNVSHYGFRVKISAQGEILIKSLDWTKL